jgi:hypothetical protein
VAAGQTYLPDNWQIISFRGATRLAKPSDVTGWELSAADLADLLNKARVRWATGTA